MREPLSAKRVEAATPRERDYKLADTGGLYLSVFTSGRTWRLKYRFGVRASPAPGHLP